MVGKVELLELPATSPTVAEVMHSCLLRTGLSGPSGSSSFVLGSPKGWLGTTYHEMLEKIPHVDLGKETLDSAVDSLWDRAIAAQHQRASGHPLDRRFGSPTTWPGYQRYSLCWPPRPARWCAAANASDACFPYGGLTRVD